MKQDKHHANQAADIPPDKMRLTALQAERLSGLTGVNAKELRQGTIAELAERLKWRIDPELFFFRRICGQVVKHNPITGLDEPVPFATVHVEDTDCSFLGLFPVESPWTWFFPLFCRREEIVTVKTDACGHFCVWIPRFEIDWILRWRRERFCFPEIFIKPTIRELLDELRHIEPPIIRRPPLPDPPPFALKDGGIALRRAEELIGREAALKLAAVERTAVIGGRTTQLDQLLDRPAFTQPVPPPLPEKIKELQARDGVKAVAAHANLPADGAGNLDLNRFIGPFRRCFNIFVPEFAPVLDAPDITFRVTQDVNGDGTEETIYSEGFFDVRWNAGAIPDVTLHASQIAISTASCRVPPVTCDDEGIRFAGLMPLKTPYHNPATGFALRPNRPHPSGLIGGAPAAPPITANAPYTWTLQLYGCNHHQGAVYYRVLYSFNGAAAVPFQNLTWPIYPFPAGTPATWVTPDANGWYPILADPNAWFPAHLLLEWPTGQTGLYQLSVQFGDGAKSVIHTTPSVGVFVGNSPLFASFTGLSWRVAGSGGPGTPLELICPVVQRPVIGGQPVDIEFIVSYQAATAHLRSVKLSAGGCGGGNPTLVSAAATAEHWHTGPLDNNFANTATFLLPHTLPQGAYSFALDIASRAFNPAGADGGHVVDWFYDPVYNHLPITLPVAVVNA